MAKVTSWLPARLSCVGMAAPQSGVAVKQGCLTGGQVDFAAIGIAGFDELQPNLAGGLVHVQSHRQGQVAHPVGLKPRAGRFAWVRLVIGQNIGVVGVEIGDQRGLGEPSRGASV